jgi:flagellar hook-associated protein 1 FlgK
MTAPVLARSVVRTRSWSIGTRDVSDFAAIQTALSGLTAHRRALEAIGHNVANAATDGYSRRRVDFTAAAGGTVPALFSKPRGVGNGVDIAGITRIRDALLEARVRAEVATKAQLEAEVDIYDRIEMALPEPSDTGLAVQLGDYWAAWHDVANQSQELASRAALLEQATTLTTALNRAGGQVENARTDVVAQLQATIADANALAGRIADLNGGIRSAVAAGLQPDDLLDQRDVLVEQLSGLVGGSAREDDDGMVDVYVGGSAFVRGDRALSLEVMDGPDATEPDVGDPFLRVHLAWSGANGEVSVDGGTVGGALRGINDVLPRYLAQLDAVAAKLVSSVNTLHQGGYALDGMTTGLDFFDPTATTARTIVVSSDVDGRPELLAAGQPSGVSGAGTFDGSVAEGIALLSASTDGADSAYRTLIGKLGVESQAVRRRSEMQASVVTQVTDAATSVRGVSIDEELGNLVASQQAYSASARVLTAVDEMLDTLITRTGVVGR